MVGVNPRDLVDLGGVGLAALLILVEYLMFRAILPIIRNHLAHMETAQREWTDAVRGLDSTIRANSEIIRLEGKLTRAEIRAARKEEL